MQTNTAKIDAIIAEHSNKSLDDLVAAKVINADQKAAHLKKPALQAQLFQLEEQLAQHKKIDQEYRARLAEQEKALTEKFEKEKADVVAELTEKAKADSKQSLRDNLLILSQFLRLAAARRAEDADSSSDESMALEGVLLHIYSGDDNAVATMLKLVNGEDEQTRSTSGETLQTTCTCFPHPGSLFAPLLTASSRPGQEGCRRPRRSARPDRNRFAVDRHRGCRRVQAGARNRPDRRQRRPNRG